MLKKLNVNLKGFTKNVQTHLETLHGIEYIVAPVTMIVEGVLPGSGGPVLYKANEIEASVNYWNGVPVTINHPTDSLGNNVSARIPEIMEEFAVGSIFNTSFDSQTNSLKAEAWINKTLLEEKFPIVYAAILDDNANMEISTGVFFDSRGEPGSFNNVSYDTTAYSCVGDHLALLPNATGACSWVDGCGLRANSKKNKAIIPFFNEISYQDIFGSLRRYVDGLDGNGYYYYVNAVYENYFIFEKVENQGERTQSLWKQNYTKTNDIVTPTGVAERVVETRVYTTVSEDFQQASGTPTIINKTTKESEMADDKTPCCPEKVKSLIAATTNSFTEDNKEMLLSLNEKQLESMIAINESLVANTNKTTNEEPKVEPLQTTKEFIAGAPEHIQLEVNALLEKAEAEKQEIIDNILKDENCTFEKSELEVFEINILSKMVGLSKKETETNTDSDQADMSANAGVVNKVNIPGDKDSLTDEQTLKPVTINWKK